MKFLKRHFVTTLFLCLALLATLAGCTTEATPAAGDNSSNTEQTICTVTRVVDGDTIVVEYQGQPEKIRLIGIDTPESVHPDKTKNVPYGKIASAFTKEQLQDQQVTLEFDTQERDQYGRLLAYVYLDGKMFNKTLLEQGQARVATYPPNVKYVEDFTQLEQTAKEQNLGIWQNYDEIFNPTASEVEATQPTTAQQAANPAAAAEGGYIGNSSSKKLHKAECSSVQKMSPYNQAEFTSIEDAKAQGYTACGICKPF